MLVKRFPPRVRRRLPARAGDRPWVVEVELNLSSLDPEKLLAGCEGFLVDDADGRQVGVVDHVETDDAGRATALLVAGGWFGRRRSRIPVDAVDSLRPRERRIVIDDRRASPRSRVGHRPG